MNNSISVIEEGIGKSSTNNNLNTIYKNLKNVHEIILFFNTNQNITIDKEQIENKKKVAAHLNYTKVKYRR